MRAPDPPRPAPSWNVLAYAYFATMVVAMLYAVATSPHRDAASPDCAHRLILLSVVDVLLDCVWTDEPPTTVDPPAPGHRLAATGF